MHYTEQETKTLKEMANVAGVLKELHELLGIDSETLSALQEKLMTDIHSDRDFQADHNKSLISDVLGRIKSGELNERDLRDAVNSQQKCISIIWGTDDVIERAQERSVEVTEDQAFLMLKNMDRRHDAERGINWDVIDYHLDELDCKEDEDPSNSPSA